MTSTRTRLGIAGVALVSAGALLVGCSGGGAPATDGKVTIKVAIDAGLEQEARDNFDARVEVFEDANPDITVEAQEYTWTAPTFTTDLAGGTLPDVFPIPFTDGRGLIANGQIADISDLVAELPYADQFNPNIAQAGQADDGGQWAVPIAAYGQGLHYNRTLFEAAGLDPDDPPATWDEVREAAKKIADATGEAGYATMTSGNTGGWILTTLVNAFGGRTESGDAKEPTIDTDPAVQEVLEFLHDLRWEDDSMGANFLYDWGTINQDFASGRIGMYVSGGGNYGNLVTQNALNPDDYGLAVLPLEGADPGLLGGGTLVAVNPKASEAEQAAAVKWIDFYYLAKLTEEDTVVETAELAASLDQPVGAPELPIFNQEQFDQYRSWIDPFVNVPVDQMAPYTDAIFDQPLIAEPRVATQDVYALLDTVVQALLTDENADIAKLLADTQTQAESLYAKAG
ncbi:ABC transporter substrate-binding protein [Microbacterium immunditiarum]|uniref:ABC-type glycerol-3-phosphate transport system substrate-binding protein n=1 Tax=Microbacterium immunditiarum TaxID=337480 RepID=A0A7Y9GND9_9MICO|nr:extracellular solute-binding protein [Microbacterium immunditiarum]NYE19693.1 ABC-type glycerol-3-phosphate transport system substrate-binding protein [Microbacterium immunditiarum]